MYSYGPPHMAEQKLDDHPEHTFSSYVRIRDVALKTCLRQWTIGRSGERVSGISMLATRHYYYYYYHQIELLMLDESTWIHFTVYKLFVLKTVNWSYIVYKVLCYFRPHNCQQANTMKYEYRSHGKQHSRCEVRWMNSKTGQRRVSQDAGRKNLIRQWQGSNFSVKKLQLLIYKDSAYWWGQKSQR